MFFSMFPVNSAVTKIIELNYTTKKFCSGIRTSFEKKDKIFIYGNPSHFYDAQFYIDHPITLVGLLGELKPKEYYPHTREEEIKYEG